MRLSVDLSVDTARAAVGRLLAARHYCCVPLPYLLQDGGDVFDWRALVGVFEMCRLTNSHGGIMLA